MAQITFEEFCHDIEVTMRRHPQWRRGQTCFNMLRAIKPDLADEVRTSPYDPFYMDEKLPGFFTWLSERWDATP